MMFYLSKILWGIFQPSSAVLIFFAAGGFFAAAGRTRSATRLFVTGAILYILFGFSPLSNWLIAPLEEQASAAAAKEPGGAAGIVVLGGAIEGRSALGDGAPHLNESGERMIEAVRLAGLHPSFPVVFTGGPDAFFGRDGQESEAELARQFFERFNITPPRLMLEGRSRNTRENAVETAKLLQLKAGQKWILVTSAFHMPRAKALFEAQGFEILAWPEDFKTSGFRGSWRLFPRASDGLKRMDFAAKEWVGLGAAWMLGYISWP
jgi:uncharacterized SAM-binding protein YcdF (DUF218 family)